MVTPVLDILNISYPCRGHIVPGQCCFPKYPPYKKGYSGSLDGAVIWATCTVSFKKYIQDTFPSPMNEW